MPEEPSDPKWPRLLSLAVHEFRTPITVVAGYIRMLLKDRAGPLSDQQRRLLEEAEKSCARLSGLIAEMSDLANLEAATGSFNRSSVDLGGLLNETIAELPEAPDREICVQLSNRTADTIVGDPVRLKSAFTALLNSVRRELVASNRLLVSQQAKEEGGRRTSWIALAAADQIDQLERADPSSLAPFDEWRGGCGLSLPIARRVIDAHNGRVWGGGEDAKSAAVVMLPVV